MGENDDLKVRIAVLEATIKGTLADIERRLAAIEGGNRWLVYLIIAAVIGTILQAVGIGK